MRARDIIGARIIAVSQERVTPGYGRRAVTAIKYIALDNGKRLSFLVHEGDGDYYVEAFVWKGKV